MITLFDKNGRAIIRLYEDWFVAYTESTHLGWLQGNAVFDRHGKHIGKFLNRKLYDNHGRIVASTQGGIRPGMAGRPGKPGKPGLSGVSGNLGISGSWSSRSYKEFFGL